MIYKKFGKTDFDVSLLGLGTMRLPLENPDSHFFMGEGAGNIDEKKAISLIQHAIDCGINYIDTAAPYHRGNSEIVVGKALKNGYREKTKIATKLPIWEVEKIEDVETLLDTQLKKLQTDCIDFYLLHALGESLWEATKKFKMIEILEKARKKGKIKYLGFSFHDQIGLFKEIIDSYDWDFCQILLNYMDIEFQAGLEGMKYAADRNIPVIVMEPLRGGQIVGKIPGDVSKIWNRAKQKRTPVDWAFKWLANRPEVNLILSGMGNIKEINENVQIFSEPDLNILSDQEKLLYEEVRNIYKSKDLIQCTECKYCLPCPENVCIPNLLSLFNNFNIYGDLKQAKQVYSILKEQNVDASKCNACGDCEKKCPQNIDIINILKKIEKKFNNI